MPPTTTTAVEVAARLNELIQIRLDGAQMHDIRAFAKEQGWNVTDRTLKRYLTRIDEQLLKHMEKDRDRLFARAVAQRDSLYARAVNAGDLSTALRILDSRERLMELFPDLAHKHGEKGATFVLHVNEVIVSPPRPALEYTPTEGADHVRTDAANHPAAPGPARLPAK